VSTTMNRTAEVKFATPSGAIETAISKDSNVLHRESGGDVRRAERRDGKEGRSFCREAGVQVHSPDRKRRGRRTVSLFTR
jgi:hypothetical protein